MIAGPAATATTAPSGERRDRPARPPRPAPEPKPKPKRLRAGRTHRNEVLAGLPEEQKPVAEQVLKGGIPAVRQAVEKQNETNKAEGKPEISAGSAADPGRAAHAGPAHRRVARQGRGGLADMGEIDLRDLRSVVVAADAAARDEETRELAEKLRTGLAERVDAEHTAWLAEIDETLSAGRVVRALRVSSRPPKAGTPVPSRAGGPPDRGDGQVAHRRHRLRSLRHRARRPRLLPRPGPGHARGHPLGADRRAARAR